LYPRGGHVQRRTLVGRLRGEELLAGGDLSGQAILGRLRWVGTVGAEELPDVIRQQVGIGQQQVVGSVVLGGGPDDRVRVLQLLSDCLQLLQGLGGLTRLSEQGILDDAGVAIE
jgi:hypothetical protein